MAAASPEADATSLSELGLPSWLDSMLQPGVGNGVFITLKASLVGLILTLLTMCYYIEDPDIAFHLYIFTGMAFVLLIVVMWFIHELRSLKPERGEKGEATDKKKD